MHKQMTFATCLALATSFSGSPAIGRERPYQASLVASVGHSEWCPPGTVQLDLMTGRYTVTAPRNWRTCRRPNWPRRTRTGVMTSLELVPIQVTFENATEGGLEHPLCRNGGHPEQIVISNGGTPVMRLTERGRTTAAPSDQTCWTGAASRLKCLLDAAFDPGDPRSAPTRLRPESPSYTLPAAVQNCSRRWPLMGAPARPGG
jgi:hypothetical protein